MSKNIVDNAEDRGSRCWAMRLGRRIFRDFGLEHRSAALGGGGVVLKTAFHIFADQGTKEVDPTGGRPPGVGMNTDPTMSTSRLTSTSSQVGRALGTRPVLTAPPTA
jgi:hypothetical protein